MVPNRDRISSFAGFIEAISGGRYNPVPPPTRFSVSKNERLLIEGGENCSYQTAIGQGVDCAITGPVAKEIQKALRDGLLSADEASAVVALIDRLPTNGTMKYVHSGADETLYVTAARMDGALRFAYRRDSEKPGSWQEHSIEVQPNGSIRSKQTRVENGVQTAVLSGAADDPAMAEKLREAYRQYQADGAISRVEAFTVRNIVDTVESGIPATAQPVGGKAQQSFAGNRL